MHLHQLMHAENSGLSEVAVTAGRTGVVQRAEDVEIDTHVDNVESGFGTWSYEGRGGAGGKLRPSRRVNKRTPYERPLTGRQVTAGGSSGVSSLPSLNKLTIASRLRSSAKQFIHSSASYLYSVVFKHFPPSLEADKESEGLSISAVQETSEGVPNVHTKQNFPALPDEDVKVVESESCVLDIGKIEEFLKQKHLSREQVGRLTQILQKHMSGTSEENNIVESEKLQDQPVGEAKDTSPIQVARAYMGEQVTRPSGLEATVQASGLAFSQVQSSPEQTLAEDRYLSYPFSRGWARGSASVRVPKRSFAIEDGMSLLGPVRRVRQKTSLLPMANPLLYSRRMTGPNKPSETRMSSPPSQSSQTAMKILETLEKLSPSPQGKLLGATTEKSVNGPQVLDKLSPPSKGKAINSLVSMAMTGADKYPHTSRAKEKIVVQNLNSIASPKPLEAKLSGKPAFGEVKLTGTEFEKPSVKTPSSMPHSRSFLKLSEGFWMNTVFEEMVESQTTSQLSSVDEAQVVSKEEAILTASSSVATFINPSVATFIKADVSTSSTISLSGPVQVSSSLSASFPIVNSSTPPHIVTASHGPTKNLFSVPSFSILAVATEMKPTQSDGAVSSNAADAMSNALAAKPATPLSCSRLTEMSELMVMSSAVVTSECTSESTRIAVPVSFTVETGSSVDAPAEVSGVSSPTLHISHTHVSPSESKDVVIMATESLVQEEGNTMPKKAAISVGASPTFLAANLFNAIPQPSVSATFLSAARTSGTSLLASCVATGVVSGTGLAGASASSLASPFSFSAQSNTTFAPNTYSGISGSSLPYTPASLFGVQSSTSSSEGKPFSATGTTVSSLSVSPFVFGALSTVGSTGREPNLAVKPLLSQSCEVQVPYCLVHQMQLSLGASSISQPEVAAMPSSSMSAPAADSKTASPLATSLFPPSSAPTASGTPAFSVSAVSSSYASSTPLATQPFVFGAGQPNPFIANAFSSSGTENSGFSTTMSGSSSSMFGSNFCSNALNVFAVGSASTSNSSSPFAFGSGLASVLQAPISALSTFGNQTVPAPSNNGQAFGLSGGQSAATAPAPNPFSTAGGAQLGLGFVLGVGGGDKSGRKFIKAKRIGGGKKGR
ncbi:hypothetical protein GOP47_0019419 [Adiantum capillus-veneris]|uniref:Nuclear pore complex protein n=1 Tax=Adiantum capillus-veneris TaxID=13818 RepID=A0A9D4UCJ1_ADICA|nr:hypothetical protein GOP47_0019419 [Adiantum capillus-veneris]